MSEKLTGLALLRAPFPENQISKLPKPTKQQTDEVKANFRAGIRCKLCGAWHHKDVIHLDYVGHAALTDRLLDCDPEWNYEWVATEPNGGPMLDRDGGAWIRLTVCGVTRLGYGDAQEKTGGNAMKERIGDALRNAAMRFGAALDLWHKGELHLDDDTQQISDKKPPKKQPIVKSDPETTSTFNYSDMLTGANSIAELVRSWTMIPKNLQKDYVELKNEIKEKLSKQPETDVPFFESGE